MLPYDATPAEGVIQIVLGRAKSAPWTPRKWSAAAELSDPSDLGQGELAPGLAEIDIRIARIREFHRRLLSAGLADSYEAAHARLAVEYLATTLERFTMLAEGKLKRLSDQSQAAADKSYISTTSKLCAGLEQTLASYKGSEDDYKKQVHAIWRGAEPPPK